MHLTDLVKRRYKSSAELQAIFGQPIAPCPLCGLLVCAMTHSGETACFNCEPSIANDSRQRAFVLTCVPDQSSPTGYIAADALAEQRDLETKLEATRQLNQRTTSLMYRGRRFRCLTLCDHRPGPRRSQTIEEWWDSLLTWEQFEKMERRNRDWVLPAPAAKAPTPRRRSRSR